MKQAAKKEYVHHVTEVKRTEGGPAPAPVSATTPRIKAVAPLDFQHHQNPFDSDGMR